MPSSDLTHRPTPSELAAHAVTTTAAHVALKTATWQTVATGLPSEQFNTDLFADYDPSTAYFGIAAARLGIDPATLSPMIDGDLEHKRIETLALKIAAADGCTLALP